MGLIYSAQTVELREVVLRDKPASLLEYSPKATVPVLVLPSGEVIDESLAVMQWGLNISDPDGWLLPDSAELIEQFDSGFKGHLDRYKYSNRYENVEAPQERQSALNYLLEIEQRLRKSSHLFGENMTLADVAIAPFVRQFANTDRAWFDSQAINGVHRWLYDFLEAPLFVACMKKYPQWHEGDQTILFPEDAS